MVQFELEGVHSGMFSHVLRVNDMRHYKEVSVWCEKNHSRILLSLKKTYLWASSKQAVRTIKLCECSGVQMGWS